MNREHRGILMGMVFGDGCLNVRLRKNPQGELKYESSELRIVHTIKQLDYLQHKAELLRTLFGGKHTVSQYDHPLPKLGKVYRMCGLSKSNPYFKTLKGLTHVNGRKTFTRQALDMLTPHGIALWYMDDGSAGRNHNKDGQVSSIYTTIATYCSEEEAQAICDYFQEVHGIEFRIGYEKAKGSHIVRANTQASKQFVALVQSYIIPSMAYKISHVTDLQFHECQTPPKEAFMCRDCGSTEQHGSAKGRCRSCYKKYRMEHEPGVREANKERCRRNYLKRKGVMI
jgi:hypothetical protein